MTPESEHGVTELGVLVSPETEKRGERENEAEEQEIGGEGYTPYR